MITTFCDTGCCRSVDVKVTKEVIGPGKSGAKSTGLKEIHPLTEKMTETEMGVLSIPQVSITPNFMAEYLKRIGASCEKPGESRAAIKKCEFSASEKAAFAEAVSPFNGIYIAVRSDEGTAAGVGLWHTGFMAADSSPEGIAIFEGVAREIMQSEFSDSVLAFKKRVGLRIEEPPGIFITPVVGNNLGSCPPIFGPVYHANIITRFVQNDAMIRLGFGIGGANMPFAKTRLLHGFEAETSEYTLPVELAEAKAIYNDKLELIGDIPMGVGYASHFLGAFLSHEAKGIIEGLRGGVSKLDKMADRPLYLELASDGRKWAVVQCAEANLGEVTKPDVPESQKILKIKRESNPRNDFGVGILGRKAVESSTVMYLPKARAYDLPELNKSLEGYVLIAPDLRMEGLREDLTFADYSNAAAIICSSETARSVGTHLNGAVREAGIVVLAGNVDQKFLEGLKEGVPEKRKLLVYANDALEEAFVATRD